MARNKPASHETRPWILWNLLLGASCLSVAAGSSSPIVLPRLALILPGTVYGVASAWRLYYGTRRPKWDRHRLKVLYATEFITTIAFALIEVAAVLVLTFVPVSDGTIALNTIMGNLQPLFSILAVVCWSLTTLYRLGNSRNSETRGAGTLLLCGAVGTLWAVIMYLTGTPELEGAEKVANCLAGGVICFAAILLIMNTSHAMRSIEENQPPSQEFEAKTQEAIKWLAKRELSDRELSVLSATAQGKTGKQIAQELKVSIATVGSYRTRGYEKLGVKKKADFVRLLALNAKAVDSSSHQSSREVSQTEHQSSHSLSQPLIRTAAACCLLVYCAYGPIDYSYQLATDDWTLGRWWPIIESLLVSTLVLLSSVPAIYSMFAHKSNIAPSSPISLEPGRTSFTLFLLGLLATGNLISEMSNTLTPESGAFCLMGLTAVFADIGLAVRTGKKQTNIRELPHIIVSGFKVAASTLPEVFGLLALAALFWSDAISYWLSFFPSSWQLLSTLYMLLVAALLLKVAISFQEATRESLSLPASSANQIINYLKGRGLNDLQTSIIILSLQGKSTDAICKELSIAPGTVGSYRSRAYNTLGVCNFEELRELLIRDTGYAS